jgi:hypothetical protein
VGDSDRALVLDSDWAVFVTRIGLTGNALVGVVVAEQVRPDSDRGGGGGG